MVDEIYDEQLSKVLSSSAKSFSGRYSRRSTENNKLEDQNIITSKVEMKHLNKNQVNIPKIDMDRLVQKSITHLKKRPQKHNHILVSENLIGNLGDSWATARRNQSDTKSFSRSSRILSFNSTVKIEDETSDEDIEDKLNIKVENQTPNFLRNTISSSTARTMQQDLPLVMYDQRTPNLISVAARSSKVFANFGSADTRNSRHSTGILCP